MNAIPFGSLETMSTLIHTAVENISCLELEAFKGMSMLAELEGQYGEEQGGDVHATRVREGGKPFLTSTVASVLYLSLSPACLGTISHLLFII